jgi:tetratricopeptide (TPR) repeat protein
MFATSFYSLGIGRWQEARDALGRVADMADQLGDHHQWAEASILLEQIKYYQGDFVGGARLAADLVTVSSHSGNSLHRAWGLTGQAENAVRLGLADQARQWLDEALELLTRNTDRTTEITAWGLRALAHLRLNDVERARQDADRAAALGAESSPTSHYLFDGFALPAEVYLTLWEQVGGRSTGPGKELERAARKAVKALNSFAGTFPLAEARAEYCSGWFQRLAGNTSEAQNTWRRGLRAAERLTMPYEQALLFCALGQAAPRRSEERESLLRQARTMFAQLGAVDDRDRAERLLSEA